MMAVRTKNVPTIWLVSSFAPSLRLDAEFTAFAPSATENIPAPTALRTVTKNQKPEGSAGNAGTYLRPRQQSANISGPIPDFSTILPESGIRSVGLKSCAKVMAGGSLNRANAAKPKRIATLMTEMIVNVCFL